MMILEPDEAVDDTEDFLGDPRVAMYDLIAKTKASGDVRLRDVLERPEWKRIRMTLQYEHDVVEGWEHQIQFLGPADPYLGMVMGLEAEQKVFCFGGEDHPCCERCGGDRGFEELKVSCTPFEWRAVCGVNCLTR